MYAICKMMKWSHLPESGGIYAQRPKLLDDFMSIWAEEGKYQQEQDAKRKKEVANASRKGKK